MSQVQYMEGWLAAQLDAQPWTARVARFSETQGPKPVGIHIEGSSGQKVAVGMVLGASTTGGACLSDDEDAWTASASTPVDASPDSPLAWADAIAQAVQAAGHEHVAEVTGFPGNGQPDKQPGVKILCTDRSAAYLTVLPGKR
jgi:hypothetical protein